jgi:hypothetical protein
MRCWVNRVLGLALMALLAGCGGGTDLTKAQLRLVNASEYGALDMSVGGSSLFSAVPYGGSASYQPADPAAMDTVVSQPGSATALVSLTPAVTKNQHYTLLAYGRQGALSTLLLDDNTGAPASGKTLLRVVNAAPDAGALDVYLTASTDPLSGAVPLQSAAAVGTLGSYLTVNSATWRLRVTGAGSKTDLRLDVAALALPSEGVDTLVLTPGRGGVMVNALLLADGSASIVRADATQARVRVAAALGGGASVTAAVGGTTLLDGVGAPALGLYTLVDAGTPAVAVSVNGSALAPSSATLAAGGDYSLLVYGSAAAPQLAWVEDDNHLPANPGGAELRLVHALDGAGALSLSADFVPLAGGVLPGTASAYAPVAASTTAALSVTSPGLASPLFSATGQTFVAGGIYSLFVVGALDAPVGILRQDR